MWLSWNWKPLQSFQVGTVLMLLACVLMLLACVLMLLACVLDCLCDCPEVENHGSRYGIILALLRDPLRIQHNPGAVDFTWIWCPKIHKHTLFFDATAQFIELSQNQNNQSTHGSSWPNWYFQDNISVIASHWTLCLQFLDEAKIYQLLGAMKAEGLPDANVE
jgi:hypothetical protein